ncbi:PA14 domain-containing protein [Capnocytophaga cynodegmi]|uniref:hypothetical protein n=1 Tax=Capnocytophaga cynodegmi TaxID=28189 RepID=UPI00385F6657
MSYAQCGSNAPKVGETVTFVWDSSNNGVPPAPVSINGVKKHYQNYIAINVIGGITYRVDSSHIIVCFNEQKLNHQNGSFTPSESGEVRIYYNGWFNDTKLTISVIGGQNTTDRKDVPPPNENNKWRTHFYREVNNFVNYLGYKDYDDHWFHERRDPVTNSNPIEVRSQGAIRAGILRYFTARSLMHNTLFKGFYYVKLGADDGTRLFVNNKKVYDRWNPAGDYSIKKQVIKLTGKDDLKYEYFNNNIPLEYIFKIDPSTDKIIENITLTSSNGTTICMGESTTLDGDDFATALPNTFTNPTFQWYYATSLTGEKKAIGSNTKQYVVNTDNFPAGGSYYFFREAKITINNIGFSEQESIMSIPIQIDIIKKPDVSIRPSSKRLCQGDNAEIQVVVNSGGTPPFTLSYKLNGVALQVKSNENTFNIPINSNQTGTFKYEYESITDGKGCTTSIHKTDNITINPLPTATFLEQNTTLCLNTPEQHITWATFTGTPPFTVRVKGSKTGGTSKEKEYPLKNNENRLVIEHNPNDIGEFTYEILWVKDVNGCPTYFTNKKKVVNVVAPSITAPENVVRCLPEIVSAVYDNNGNTIITENSYVLPLGDTTLDVVVNSVPCCPNPTLKWTINNDLSNTRTGQPSTLGNISFENATSSDKTYTITYWLECNGQKYNHIMRQVRITPRPNLEFQ